MRIMEILNEDEDKLFEAYLSHPGLSHPKDRQRFAEYALVANHNESGFWCRENALLRAGLSEDEIKRLSEAYNWIGDTLEALR
jgi:hypothetical protein